MQYGGGPIPPRVSSYLIVSSSVELTEYLRTTSLIRFESRNVWYFWYDFLNRMKKKCNENTEINECLNKVIFQSYIWDVCLILSNVTYLVRTFL